MERRCQICQKFMGVKDRLEACTWSLPPTSKGALPKLVGAHKECWEKASPGKKVEIHRTSSIKPHFTDSVPKVLVCVEGGVVQEVWSDNPVEFYLVDYDVDGVDKVGEDLLAIDGDLANAFRWQDPCDPNHYFYAAVDTIDKEEKDEEAVPSS
jgi:hypothetical protein